MKNYIIIPGSANTPYENWYQWAKEELEKQGFNVCVPYLPQGEFQNYKVWAKIITSYIKSGVINKNTTIIAHDVACVFITRLLIETKTSIAGIIAISPFNIITGMEEDKLNKSFIVKNDKLKKIDRYVKFYHAIIADNDPYITEDVFNKFCEATGAKKHEVVGAGHFNGKVKTFNELIELIDDINKII